MSDFIEDFLEGLDKDGQRPRKSSGIEKILMNSRDNQGTVVFAPFLDTNTKKFYVPVNDVRELRTTISRYRDGNDEVWMKILPKEFYGNLTESQSKLYDEVLGLFDQYNADLGDISNKWSKIRRRSYSLFQGVLINHLNSQGAQQRDRIGKPVLLVFPSRQPINELAVAIKNKIAGMNNSKEWIPAVFSPTSSGREGVVTISFTKPDSPGYDCSVGFEFNSSYAKIIDTEKGFPEEVTNEFGDVVSEFLGWQNGESGRFSEANFSELRKILTMEISKLSVDASRTEAPLENKNGIDPMLSNAPAQEESIPPTDSDAPKDELPF